jgi:hypothetical protein
VWCQAPALPSGSELVRAIRELKLDPEQCYLVRDFSFTRDDIKLFFNDGYLIFSAPVAGRRVAAIFAGAEDPADGELLLLPPDQRERQSLAKHARTPNLDEHFHAAALTFTDSTQQELLEEIRRAGRGQDPIVGQVLAQQWNPVVSALAGSVAQRVALDLMTPGEADGFLFASFDSERLENFDVVFDPMADDEILVGRSGRQGEAFSYDVWSSFPARTVRMGTAVNLPARFEFTSYRIKAALDEMLHLKATTTASFKVGAAPLRAIQFALSRAERVTGVRLDGDPAEIVPSDSERSRALRADENDAFMVVTPRELPPNSVHEVEITHEGDVIEDRGNGVYSVSARSNWYPRAALEFARYDLEFRYPQQLTLVIPGELVEDRTQNGQHITRRRTQAPVRVAGFNLGQYTRTSKETSGLKLDVYGNRGLDPALAPRPRTILLPPARPLYRGAPTLPQTIVQTAPPPDPDARLQAVAKDMSESIAFFTSAFGPPALNTLTVSPMPGTSGFGFPGLIYLSTLSYLDEMERPQAARDARQRTYFTDLMAPHEVAHQWWGNVVSTAAYQDDWIVEALAQYSALLWLEKKRGAGAMQQELNQYRQDLLAKGGEGETVESFGPLTWGYRLEGAQWPDTWRTITYEKGAWVFHMLRSRMGDARFLKMLAELRRRFEYKTVTTRDLHALAREIASPAVSGASIDDFFASWVRSTGLPEVRVRFSTSGRAPEVKVSGSIDYNGSNLRDFATEIPIEIQFPGGERRIEWVHSSGRTEPFTMTLPRVPTRIGIAQNLTLAYER